MKIRRRFGEAALEDELSELTTHWRLITFSNDFAWFAHYFASNKSCRECSQKLVISCSTTLDCTRRDSDGLYGRGCSSKFLRCHKGKRYVYTCPNNLKFNVETAKCEQRQQIIACLNNMGNDRIIVKADYPFDCSKRKDGVYGSGKCSTTYYHCSRGHSTEMSCPANLYYNDKLKACDEIDSVDECNLLNALRGFDERRESHLGQRGKYIERNLMSNRGGSIFDVNRGYGSDNRRLSLGKEKSKSIVIGIKRDLYEASSWVRGSKMNCTGLKDGAYPMVKNKCSKYFWRCIDGQITGRICREELFFNTITGKCDIANNITNCANKKKSLVTRSVIESNCNGSNDGLVESSACSEFYYNCTAGKLSRCPRDQVYNKRQKRCDFDFSVPECITVESFLKSAAGNSIHISKIISAPELSDFCGRNGDGIFSAGCQNYFYFCSLGHGYHVKCPEGLFFDSETKTCNHKEYVQSCNIPTEDLGYVTNDYATVLAIMNDDDDDDDDDEEVEEMGDYKIQTLHNQKTNEKSDEGLPVVYSIPISHSKSLPFLPEDLIFHENAQICDSVSNIDGCSDNDKKEPFSATNTDTDWEITSEEITDQSYDDTAVQEQNFCGHLNDGIYFNDCGNKYLICNGGNSFAYACPEGQIVDPTSKTCNELENIPTCMSAKYRLLDNLGSLLKRVSDVFVASNSVDLRWLLGSGIVKEKLRIPAGYITFRRTTVIVGVGVGFGAAIVSYFFIKRFWRGLSRNGSEEYNDAIENLPNGFVIPQVRSGRTKGTLSVGSSQRNSYRCGNIPLGESDIISSLQLLQEILQRMERAVTMLDMVKNRSEKDCKRSELLSSVLDRLRILETDITRVVHEGGYEKEILSLDETFWSAGGSQRAGTLSVLSDDSFWSAHDDLPLSIDDADVLMREPLNLDKDLLHFYQNGIKAVETGEVNCRKIRTEFCCCEDDGDFKAKVWCVRQAFTEILSDEHNRVWLSQAGRQVIADLLRHASKDPIPFYLAYDAMMKYLNETQHLEIVENELKQRGVPELGFWDVVLDYILIDAFEDLSRPPSAVLAVTRNMFLNQAMKESTLVTVIWSMLKAKRARLAVVNGFISHFYDISEVVSHLLLWEQMCSFVVDIFNVKKVRYTSLKDLAEDVRLILETRLEMIQTRLSTELLPPS
ncbi:Protein FAM73B [Dirofilaria immitis]|nr:Protein FAM73B [Dirofilaria immitis]